MPRWWYFISSIMQQLRVSSRDRQMADPKPRIRGAASRKERHT